MKAQENGSCDFRCAGFTLSPAWVRLGGERQGDNGADGCGSFAGISPDCLHPCSTHQLQTIQVPAINRTHCKPSPQGCVSQRIYVIPVKSPAGANNLYALQTIATAAQLADYLRQLAEALFIEEVNP
jgi:hypothetical protein